MVGRGVLKVTSGELRLENVLQTGQAFRWILEEGIYTTTMRIIPGKYSIIALSQDLNTGCITFDTPNENIGIDTVQNHLRNYFRLEVDLHSIHQNQWLAKDQKFKMLEHKGIRILGQEPWETLVSFICSSNNNIGRISKMCHALAQNFGDYIGKFQERDYYSFPTSNQLAENATESTLRDLGFGYRAKYIIETAKKFVQAKQEVGVDNDTDFLQKIAKEKDYLEVREFLMGFCGVGPKVADCACLMGLKMDEVVPIDVHVGRIAKRDYSISASKKELQAIKSRYDQLPITKKKINLELDFIRLKFVELWGTHAGWAQGLLFFRETEKNSNSPKKRTKLDETTVISKKLKFEEEEKLIEVEVKAE
ncbi:N-glycosylase/DNA lyase [Nakaseomyces bracarensis]|uniref:DNA-(apurinic or apyrimidinic site) lyase n=1 Tax=Nakaseomyces bracarensis TaxID=273131 RepID=A0ABR4NXB4_9SACH